MIAYFGSQEQRLIATNVPRQEEGGGAARKQQRQATRVAAEAQDRYFTIYGVQLPTCGTYLGRPMSKIDSGLAGGI